MTTKSNDESTDQAKLTGQSGKLPKQPEPKGKRKPVKQRDLQANSPGTYITKGQPQAVPGDDDQDET